MKELLSVNCTCCVMLTFNVGYSVSEHKLIIIVVILLRANIFANRFTPWRTTFKFSFVQNFALCVINTYSQCALIQVRNNFPYIFKVFQISLVASRLEQFCKNFENAREINP